MTWLLSLATGLLSAVFGAIGLGVLADRWTVWFRVSNFEGAAGYFVIFQALFGAVGGFAIGVICSRYAVVDDQAHFLRGLSVALGCDAGVLGVLAILSYLIADHPPKLHGHPLAVEIEIRTPPRHPLVGPTPPTPMVSIENASGRTTSYQSAAKESAIHEPAEDRWRIPVSLPLRSSSASKTLRVSWTNGFSWVVSMPLRAKPTEADVEWTDWMPPNDTSVREEWARPGLDLRFLLRYRVVVQRPLPPQPAEAASAPSVEERERAAFEKLPPNVALRDLILWTREGVSASVREQACQAVAARPDLSAEMARLIADDDDGGAAEALRLVERLPDPTGVAPAVLQAGRELRDRLARIVEITAAQDPGYEAAAGFSVRFSAWMSAVRRLRQQGAGDYTPELRQILVLARKRPDSVVLRGDVVRVASFYLHEWAGDPPLASDPPPR